ncbi:sulfur carrier protein ThiS [Egibacter rhizosphaerae]|uniref:Sulfur carrier protein ThiS n=1 Tax=Egibacter rhizosphaerae TaxID=1670831 RepID=A0A411YAB8_9ACTN|nr:sulfur carrier protein ThiS [Egibacter rhizosphaerae]QBI18160.1 sulfur carrier protein ThiS [Egibacter rhizosphaerae]
MARIHVNGEPRTVTEGATVADLVTELGQDPERPGVAVAVDGEVVPRGQWTEAALVEGAQVEVVGAAQGG